MKKRAKIGVIYNPIRNDMYWAVEGHGAFLNEQPIHVSAETDLRRSIVCVEYGAAYGNPALIRRKLDREVRPILELPVHAVRSLGAATMNLMTVATGCAEAYIETGLKPWDMAAGELIVREAGGCISAISRNREFSLTGAEIIAACTPSITDSLASLISAHNI